MLTKIPHFKEVVISSFDCPHCGYSNSEIQSAMALAEKGIKITCIVTDAKDLNRQLVRTEYASLSIPELELELPASFKKSYLTTIEGILQNTVQDLTSGQEHRKEQYPDIYAKIDSIIAKIEAFLANPTKLTVIIDDPSGNSYVESYCHPKTDPKIRYIFYVRSREQMVQMGYRAEDEEANEKDAGEEDGIDAGPHEIGKQEVFHFHTNCPACQKPTETRMHLIEIPYFKEVLIMATTCDLCGYKTNEVKTSGAVSEKGKRITLKVTSIEDLSRDILKSETCRLCIPEIDLELDTGTLGGRFTTLEGLLMQVHNELQSKVSFLHGDSADNEKNTLFQALLANIISICRGERDFNVIIDDPLANSYLQNIYAPDEDPFMTIEYYERTEEQNEDLGINDMVLEGYENEENSKN